MKKAKAPILNESLVRNGMLARRDGLEFDSVEKKLLRHPHGLKSWEHGWNLEDLALRQDKCTANKAQRAKRVRKNRAATIR